MHQGITRRAAKSVVRSGTGADRLPSRTLRLLVSLTVDRVLAEARFRCPGWSLSFAAVHDEGACDSHLDCAVPVTDDGRERLKKGMLCS